MKPLVVISKENPASQNIKSALFELESLNEVGEGFWSAKEFDIAEYSGSIVEIVPKHDAQYYIFASTHKSASQTPCLTVHTPGNWGSADLGGKPKTLNIAYASKVKAIAQSLAKHAAGLEGWQVSVEVDHHGPSLQRPVVFAEIGSSEREWQNAKAGIAVAQAILDAIRSNRIFPSFVGFGGTHYAPKFTPKIIGSEVAFGHIISGYAIERDGCDLQMVLQAFEKNVEKPKGAMVDWKGLKKEAKDALISHLESLGIEWQKA
ncbi:MAG: D-aminoacyl-tRNA deacylase [Candidatus Anstonellaceae archaeon]